MSHEAQVYTFQSTPSARQFLELPPDGDYYSAKDFDLLKAECKAWRERALTAEAQRDHTESVGDNLANVVEQQAVELAAIKAQLPSHWEWIEVFVGGRFDGHQAHEGIYSGPARSEIKPSVAGTEIRQRPLFAIAPASLEVAGLVEVLQKIMRLDVRGHSLQDRLQFSTEGRALLDAVDEALGGIRMPQDFQARVVAWLIDCFGARIACDPMERNHRFLEEALELGQACGCTQDEALKLVEYVYGREVGEKSQEVGGVMVTLAALCFAQRLDIHRDGETELARITQPEVMERIREKQARKPAMSPLPGVYP